MGGAPFPGQDPSGSDVSNTSPGGHTSDGPPAAGHPQFYVHEGDKAIALTIDDGPSSKYTPQVLALLAQYKIPATFCMIGENADNAATGRRPSSRSAPSWACAPWTGPSTRATGHAPAPTTSSRTS